MLYKEFDRVSNFGELRQFLKFLVQTPLEIEVYDLYDSFYVS